MKRVRDYCVLTLSATAFTALLILSLLFGGNALEMTGLFAKHLIGQADLPDYMYILKVCAEQDYETCSDLAAERVIEKSSSNASALEHMAIRNTRSGETEKAASFFAAYFSQGGASAKANYWYSQLLLKQGEEEKALRWSYLAVLEEPENETYSKALHEQLVKQNKSIEALAMIGFITKGRPQAYRYWSGEIARLEIGIRDLEELMKNDISIPIRGEEAFVPVVEASSKKLKFFKMVGGNCVGCPKTMKFSDAKVVSRLRHNFLIVTQ